MTGEEGSGRGSGEVGEADGALPAVGGTPVGPFHLRPAAGGGGGVSGTFPGAITDDDVGLIIEAEGPDAGDVGREKPGAGGFGFVTVELAEPGSTIGLLPGGTLEPPE